MQREEEETRVEERNRREEKKREKRKGRDGGLIMFVRKVKTQEEEFVQKVE